MEGLKSYEVVQKGDKGWIDWYSTKNHAANFMSFMSFMSPTRSPASSDKAVLPAPSLLFAHLSLGGASLPRYFHNLHAVTKTVYSKSNLVAPSPAATPVHDDAASLIWLVGRARPPVFHILWLKSALELFKICTGNTHAPRCGDWMFHCCWCSCWV